MPDTPERPLEKDEWWIGREMLDKLQTLDFAVVPLRKYWNFKSAGVRVRITEVVEPEKEET